MEGDPTHFLSGVIMKLFVLSLSAWTCSLVPVLLLTVALFPSQVFAGYSIYQTTNTGPQTFLNKNVGYYWEFALDNTANLGPHNDVSVELSIKYVAQTSEPVVVTLYDKNGIVLSSAQKLPGYSPNQFPQRTLFTLAFGSPYTFTANDSYYVTITSAALTSSQTWQIKSGNITGTGLIEKNRGFFNPETDPLPPFDNIPDPPPAPEVPEPTSLAVWGLACLGLASAKRRLSRSVDR